MVYSSLDSDNGYFDKKFKSTIVIKSKLCIMCTQNNPYCSLLPCLHGPLCHECFKFFENHECLICDEIITGVLQF